MKIAHIIVSIFSSLPFRKKNGSPIFGKDYKQTMLSKLGREQFTFLIKKGLNVPVVLL